MANQEGAPENNFILGDNQISKRKAQSYAGVAGIKLSPETLELYAKLRGNDEINKGDQQLLAEVLYHQGEDEKLKQFKATYPNIFK